MPRRVDWMTSGLRISMRRFLKSWKISLPTIPVEKKAKAECKQEERLSTSMQESWANRSSAYPVSDGSTIAQQ